MQQDTGEARRLWGAHAALALALFLLAVPAVVMDTQASQQLTSFPPAFDRFMSAVRAATPPLARLLILDPYTDPQHHLFLRSRYDLYPRKVIMQPVASKFYTRNTVTMRWGYLVGRAHYHHLGYVVIWVMPVAGAPDEWGWALPTLLRGPRHRLRLQMTSGWGRLERVP